MDLSNLDAGSIVAVGVCGLIVVVAIVRFIIYLVSNKKDK